MQNRIRTAVFAFALLFASTACGSLTAASPSGRWTGSWTSYSTGHKGPLKAHVRRIDSETYRAVFTGRFFVVVPFVYPATLKRVPGTCNQYQTSTRLPLMGEYRMDATVGGNRFEANYRSRNDRGRFSLSR